MMLIGPEVASEWTFSIHLIAQRCPNVPRKQAADVVDIPQFHGHLLLSCRRNSLLESSQTAVRGQSSIMT